MAIHIKNKKEIESMKHGGHILSEVLWECMRAIRPGVSELDIDRLAEKRIREMGGEPGFMKVKGYHHTICVATNDVVVHGIPTDYKFKEGDVVCIDCGVYYDGLHTDMAETIIVDNGRRFGEASTLGVQLTVENGEEKKNFLEMGKRALEAGIKQAKNGNRIGDISKAIQDIVEKEGGYSIVRSLIGHGVGKELHEEPEVPGFVDKKIEKTPLLTEGMTIAIEVIYNMGGPEVEYAENNDGWTIVSADRSLSAVFERSVLITAEDPLILTQ